MPISFPTPLQDEVLWILGGRGGRGNTADGQYDSIYKLVCQSKPGTSPGCQWEKSEHSMITVDLNTPKISTAENLVFLDPLESGESKNV